MFMKRHCAAAVSVVGLLVLSTGGAHVQARAQEMPAHSQSSRKIQLDVEVTTSKGVPVKALTEKDFTVLDNKKPAQIASFASVDGKDTPAEVLIVFDSVNTPFTYLGYQREQVMKYLRSNGGALPYPTTFAVLTDMSFSMNNDATKDGNALADKLAHTDIGLREIDRSQGFWGAADRMTLSLNGLRSLAVVEAKKPGRKLVLWISPGWPLLSGPEVDLDADQEDDVYHEAIIFSRELRRADITLYSVNSWGATESLSREFFYQSFLGGLKGPTDAQWGDVSVQVLAAQTGGLVLSSSGIVEMMNQCIEDANHYYRIVLNAAPDEKPNVYHQIEVKVAQKDVKVRTRDGYYSQP
jgi:VWFA-related protein